MIGYVYTKLARNVQICRMKRYLLCAGMNSGVLLLRNTDWNRDLFAQMAAYGTTPMNVTKEAVRLLHEDDRCFCL